MNHTTRSLYAIDPETQKVRLVVQVTPDGWSEAELEKVFAGLIPVLGNASIPVAIVLSKDTAFVIRFEDKEKHFDIDEVDVAEVISPFELDPDPGKLFDTVSKWMHEVANNAEAFVPEALLPKRIPEIVRLVVGAQLRDRDGSIGLPDKQVTAPVEADS